MEHDFKPGNAYRLGPVGSVVIGDVLGAGAFARVYEAKLRVPAQDEKLVALRVNQSPGLDTRFGRDRRILGAAQIKGAVIPEAPLALMAGNYSFQASVSELVVGQNLAAYARSSGGQLPPREVASIMAQLGRTMNDASRKGFAHLDLKPANIMRDGRSGSVAVVDWDLVEPIGTDLGESVPGTPQYMSPEVARGGIPVHPKMDVFSAGATMARLGNGTDFLSFRGVRYSQEALAYIDRNRKQAGMDDPVLDAAAKRATHPDLTKRGTALDLMTDVAAYPEARKHYDRDDIEQVVEHLVHRSADFRNRNPHLEAAVALGLLQDLPQNHARHRSLMAVASLAPPLALADPGPAARPLPSPVRAPESVSAHTETSTMSPLPAPRRSGPKR